MESTSKVHPAELARPNCIAVVHDTLTKVFGGAAKYWASLQVGHRERYSVQRLLSFRDYYERTSPTRVFVVCSASLVPAFALAVVMECIPLKPPEAGWKANYAFWIRLSVSSLPISFGAVFQVLEVIEPDVISTAGIAVTAVGSCAGYVALTMSLAASWRFPVPFGYVFCVPPFVGLYMVLFVLSIGPRVLARTPVLRRQLFSQLLIVAAQAILAIAYPLFSAVFNQLSGMQQSAFIFVLPVIKFCIKEVIARMESHLEECVGLIVVFSVDVCNVVYVAVCIQTAISPLTSVLMLGSDAFFVMLALRSIYYHADASHSWRKERLKGGYLDDLMELIREAFRYANKPNAFPVPIRVRAPIELPLSLESARFITSFTQSGEMLGKPNPCQLNFMLYAMVEFISFVGLSLLLKRKFGFSPLYQLAFVLETQRGILQGHFFLWVSWILQITLVHNGELQPK